MVNIYFVRPYNFVLFYKCFLKLNTLSCMLFPAVGREEERAVSTIQAIRQNKEDFGGKNHV